MRGDIQRLVRELLGRTEPGRAWDWDDLWYVGGPYEFERLVAELWRELGYRVTRTAGSGDGGIDVLAKRSGWTPFGAKTVAIQAKYLGPDYEVGPAPVRELYGALAVAGANVGVLVTSATFSDRARYEAEQLDIELVSGGDLTRWLNGTKIPAPDADYL